MRDPISFSTGLKKYCISCEFQCDAFNENNNNNKSRILGSTLQSLDEHVGIALSVRMFKIFVSLFRFLSF